MGIFSINGLIATVVSWRGVLSERLGLRGLSERAGPGLRENEAYLGRDDGSGARKT